MYNYAINHNLLLALQFLFICRGIKHLIGVNITIQGVPKMLKKVFNFAPTGNT